MSIPLKKSAVMLAAIKACADSLIPKPMPTLQMMAIGNRMSTESWNTIKKTRLWTMMSRQAWF